MMITYGIFTLEQALLVAMQHANHEQRDWHVMRAQSATQAESSYGICPGAFQPDADAWLPVLRVGPVPAPLMLPVGQPIERAIRDVRNALAGMIGMEDQRLILNGPAMAERIQDVRATLQRASASVESAARDVANVLTGAQLREDEYDRLQFAVFNGLEDEGDQQRAMAALARLRGRGT